MGVFVVSALLVREAPNKINNATFNWVEPLKAILPTVLKQAIKRKTVEINPKLTIQPTI